MQLVVRDYGLQVLVGLTYASGIVWGSEGHPASFVRNFGDYFSLVVRCFNLMAK
jgi:hypothetical protein